MQSIQFMLRVDNLFKSFGVIPACDGVSFDLYPGQVLGIVGESGSSKSTFGDLP
ncbi:ATP-binding cassette domain-containing protein [Cylindrospermopsis raciborskii]|uniref:ATP-binding cassette domain-containing protein n=1 Tax=Cylindrospermopsis raciborskii TaxID=77022 RepID=UPI0015A70601|nr:ATP-binding cassette domain-containing protein [Cylindrospermopsis raciborskii]